MGEVLTVPTTSDEDLYRKSSFYEQMVEHVFISEVLQEVWFRFHQTVEVLRSEIDASGYDVVLACNGVLRHIQLKTSAVSGKTASQKVNLALAAKPSGCVVWILRELDPTQQRMRLSYRFFGGTAGSPLPELHGLKTGKHTKGNKDGVKAERPSIRVIPKTRFQSIGSTKVLVCHLFGFKSGYPTALNAMIVAYNHPVSSDISFRTAHMTPVVTLRPISRDDLPRLFEFQLDPELHRVAVTRPRTAEAFAVHWEKIFSDTSTVVRAIMANGELTGAISSFQMDGVNSVGYWLGREFWGRGIASWALKLLLIEVSIRPLHARVATSNVASMRILQKCGFVIEQIRFAPEDALFPECEEALLILE